MNKNYQRGVRFERDTIKEHQKMGFKTIRASGSHGLFDIVVFNFNGYDIRFIQCKVKKNTKNHKNIILTSEYKTYNDQKIQTYKLTKYTR